MPVLRSSVVIASRIGTRVELFDTSCMLVGWLLMVAKLEDQDQVDELLGTADIIVVLLDLSSVASIEYVFDIWMPRLLDLERDEKLKNEVQISLIGTKADIVSNDVTGPINDLQSEFGEVCFGILGLL